MRRIFTAITAVSLAFSLVASATPANAAVAGYDSAYAGESAFLNLNQGQTGTFTVFFANTGSTSWVKGTGTQVDLAACLDDKVTCNAQDATEAPFNSGWQSTTRYASTTQTTVAPGQIGTFTYNVMVPATQAAGTYRFNGALVLASTGADIRNEGYYQDVTVGAGSGAASITSLTPNTGTVAGGTSVTIAGSGFVCTPAFPTVSFGTNNATVTSCGATALTATSPAGAATGVVNVTVTNTGGVASNALPYTYTDTTRPVFTSFTVTGSLVTVTFSEPVCRANPFNTGGTDWNVLNVSAPGPNAVTGDSLPICNPTTSPTNAVTTATLQLTTAMPNGAFVETTLNAVGVATTASDNENIRDVAGNFAAAPQSRQATATAPETTPPTIISITGAVGASTITITFSEPVQCPGLTFGPEDFSMTDNGPAIDPTITGPGTNTCGTTPLTADNSFSVTLSAPLPAATTYVVTLTPEAGQLTDIVGNNLANPTNFSFTTGASDFTPPTIIDARMVNNAGPSTDFVEAGDSFALTFSEAMVNTTTGTISLQDQDGTTATITCTVVVGPNNGTCTFNAAATVLTVTLTGTLAVTGAGTTPGMAIPFNITAMTNFTDTQGNPPNILGSPDRLVDYE